MSDHEICDRVIADKNERIERLEKTLSLIVSAIRSGPMKSIGSIDSHYCPQIYKGWLADVMRKDD